MKTLCRGDLVSIETWFQPEGRMCACRNWIVRDASTMKEIGRGTRCVAVFLHLLPTPSAPGSSLDAPREAEYRC